MSPTHSITPTQIVVDLFGYAQDLNLKIAIKQQQWMSDLKPD
jgi:hypothetical protein